MRSKEIEAVDGAPSGKGIVWALRDTGVSEKGPEIRMAALDSYAWAKASEVEELDAMVAEAVGAIAEISRVLMRRRPGMFTEDKLTNPGEIAILCPEWEVLREELNSADGLFLIGMLSSLESYKGKLKLLRELAGEARRESRFANRQAAIISREHNLPRT